MTEVINLIPVAGLKYYLTENELQNIIDNKISVMLVENPSGVIEVFTKNPRTARPSEQIGVMATGKFRSNKDDFNWLARENFRGYLYQFVDSKPKALELMNSNPFQENNSFYLEAMDYDDSNIGILVEKFNTQKKENVRRITPANHQTTSLSGTMTTTTSSWTLYEHEVEKQKQNRKEKEKMNLNLNDLGIKFGKASAQFKLSINGIAVQGQNKDYFVWDGKNNTLVNVSNMVFDFDALYFMPSKEVKVGDTILHGNSAVSVTEVKDGKVTGVRYSDQTEVTIPAMKNIFGFNFYTKVVNLFGDGFLSGMTGAAQGEFNPMMLMLLSQNGNNFGDIGQMMLLSQLSGSLFK